MIRQPLRRFRGAAIVCRSAAKTVFRAAFTAFLWERALVCARLRGVFGRLLQTKSPCEPNGEEQEETLRAAGNYASTLVGLKRFEEARSLLLKTLPVRRVIGDSNDLSLNTRLNYARALYKDPAATLDDLREAVTTLEDTDRIARRVLGSAHPLVKIIGNNLRLARAALQAAPEK